MNALATRPTFHPLVTRRTQLAPRAPASPMVLEELLARLAELREKVTALECRPQHQIIAQPTTFVPAPAEPVDYTDPTPMTPPAAAPTRRVKVRHAKLREFFD